MAKYLVEEAVEEKDITAYLIYAYFLLNGEDPFEKNLEMAVQLYEKADNLNNLDASVYLGKYF